MQISSPFDDDDFSPLTVKNTLLQSCYLLNTEWAYGIAVYTGNETKLGKGIAEPKITAADAKLDKLTTTIFIFQIVVVLILDVSTNIWNNYEKSKVLGFHFLHQRVNFVLRVKKIMQGE